jgi:hypothetical protein
MSSALQVFWDATQCLQVNLQLKGQSVQGAYLLRLTDPEYEGNVPQSR